MQPQKHKHFGYFTTIRFYYPKFSDQSGTLKQNLVILFSDHMNSDFLTEISAKAVIRGLELGH